MQAIDLVFRKVLTNRTLEKFISLLQNEIKDHNDNVELKRLSKILKEKIKILLDFSKWLDDKVKKSKKMMLAQHAMTFLKVLGYVSFRFFLA